MDRDEEYYHKNFTKLLDTYTFEEIFEYFTDYEDWEILLYLYREGLLKLKFNNTQMELDFN